MSPKLAFLPEALSALDVVADWFNSEDIDPPAKRFGPTIVLGHVLDVKEFPATIDDVERLFQYAPEVSEHHFYEITGDNKDRLITVTDHGLQQSLLKELKHNA